MGITKVDKVIIAVLLAVSIGVFILANIINGGNRVASILILRIDGEETRYELNDVDSTIDFEFRNEKGRLIIDNVRVSMEKMSLEICPRQICSKIGWIEKAGESIICLPNRVSVILDGGSEEREIDALSS